MKRRKISGEITVFLSLIFVLLVSFIGNLVASADLQVGKNRRRAVMDRAVYSAFGEYQRELLEEYELFAIEGSYETGSYAEENLIRRLDYYGADSLESKLTGIQYLTDSKGQVFFDQVVLYMRNYSGIELAADLLGSSGGWSEQEIKGNESEKTMQDTDEKLENTLAENEVALPEKDNPIATIANVKKSPLLTMIMPKEKSISTKAVSLDAMVSHRPLQTGRGTFQRKNDADTPVSNLLFGEYMMSHFSNAVEEEVPDTALSYEMEYLIAGKESDEKNLESVAKKILGIRMGMNYLYLMTDVEKQGEAEALAATLATLVALPVATELVKQAILAAWSYGESIMDLRSLLAGHKTAVVKTKDTWQLSLGNLTKLGTAEDTSEGSHVEDGISYSEYLRILLFLKEKDACCMRALDLIEQNLQKRKGLGWFQADYCITGIQLDSRTTFEHGITYTFPTYFAYR